MNQPCYIMFMNFYVNERPLDISGVLKLVNTYEINKYTSNIIYANRFNIDEKTYIFDIYDNLSKDESGMTSFNFNSTPELTFNSSIACRVDITVVSHIESVSTLTQYIMNEIGGNNNMYNFIFRDAGSLGSLDDKEFKDIKDKINELHFYINSIKRLELTTAIHKQSTKDCIILHLPIEQNEYYYECEQCKGHISIDEFKKWMYIKNTCPQCRLKIKNFPQLYYNPESVQ